MKLQSAAIASLLLASALALGGCQRNIVKAAPPSVSTPPETVPPPATPPPHPQTTSASEPEPKPEPPPSTPPATKPAPVHPKPAPSAEPAPATPPEPKPEAPEIAPQLTPQQQTADEQRTADDIQAAEKNLQLASGRQLNTSQEDLVEKVRDFLGQAHEAVRAGDWVRASNLAHKAHILSDDLVKSL